MRLIAMLLILATCGLTVAPSAAQPAKPTAPVSAFDAKVQRVKEAMMADPGKAMTLARELRADAEELRDVPAQAIGRATAQWLEAEALLGMNKASDASPIATEALELIKRYGRGTKLHGDLLRSLAGIAAIEGHVRKALLLYQAAHDIFRTAGERRSRAIVLQDIGQIYWEAGDYSRVLDYFRQSEDAFSDDPALLLTMRNNRAEVLRTMGRYAEAEQNYLAALKDARAFDSPTLEARILTNLSVAQAYAGKLDAAERSARAGLRLAQGDAAEWRPFLVGAMAEVAARRGNEARAAELLGHVFSGVDITKSSMAYRELHQLASRIYERVGQTSLALEHLQAFQRLDKEAQGLIASSASQLMAARFDSANQKARIASLKQGQLERDIQIERQQTRFRTILFSGLAIAGAIILALLTISALRIRRSRNEVRAANVVLSETNTKLEKALKAKTEFLAMTSHEIRTPLNGILGMTQILLANRSIDPEMREQVQVVHGAGETMRALVDDILDVAKMETGEVQVVLEDVDLHRMLTDAATLWRGHATGKNVTLDLDVSGAPVRIRSDNARVRQIVFNLLSNAVKFTPAGKISLRAFASDGPDPELVIEVEDSGIGIPADQLDQIFESFHQVDGGMSRQFSGTGLGLAICRNLATALGGRITVKSEEKCGSIFTLVIPFEPVQTPVRAKPLTLADSRLLLVEGNAMTEGVMRSLLEPVVETLECVADGTSAIAAVQGGTVDHLLIEAKSATIDDLSPTDALRRIVEAAIDAGVVCSVLIAPSESLPLDAVAQMGATRLILKPIGGAALVTALQSAHIESHGSVPTTQAA